MNEPMRLHYIVYEMAYLVKKNVEMPSTMMEIDWDYPGVIEKLSKFSRISILGDYIFSVIAVHFRCYFRENADLFELNDVTEIEKLFENYETQVSSFKKEIKTDEEIEDFDKAFLGWFYNEEGQFMKLWEAITDEVFFLLFANRNFLLNFNQSLAYCLKNGDVPISTIHQSENGKIKRYRIPSWVKKAVYLRDHGRCVLCQKDLTGLISTDISLHYDHIVPLNLWGVNDPCNIQLLCEKCNLQKSGKKELTGIKYPAWW